MGSPKASRPLPEQRSLLQRHHPVVLGEDDDSLSIRTSRRARRLILRVVPPYRLELVVPQGTRPAVVEDFCRRHADWIARTRAAIRARYRRSHETLPTTVRLAALGSDWQIVYRPAPGRRPRYSVEGHRVEVIVPEADPELQQRALRAWLLAQARTHLPAWLEREAGRAGLRPARVQIRQQKTRWGSCSARGTISLNASALLLEPALARYLLIHELCHLGCLNHSRRFWRRVERLEPAFETLDRRLAGAWTDIPLWALPR